MKRRRKKDEIVNEKGRKMKYKGEIEVKKVKLM
jgi:hypothetical protein